MLIRKKLLSYGIIPPFYLKMVQLGRSFHVGGSFPMGGQDPVFRSDRLGRPGDFASPPPGRHHVPVDPGDHHHLFGHGQFRQDRPRNHWTTRMFRKNALITGGSRGLGLEVARLLAGNGYRVTIVGRNAEKTGVGCPIVHRRRAPRAGLRPVQPSQTREFLRRLEDESFDLLINNAGASRFGAFLELSQQAVEELIYLNFAAPGR